MASRPFPTLLRPRMTCGSQRRWSRPLLQTALKIEYNTAEIAEVVLVICTCERVAVTGEHVVNLYRADCHVVIHIHIQPAAVCHCERVLGPGRAEGSPSEIDRFDQARVGVRIGAAEQNFSEGSHFPR